MGILELGPSPEAGLRKRLTVALFAVLAVGVGLVLIFRDPARTAFFPPCPVHALTGLHCPGCGTLRALHQLSQGNVRGAIDLNVLMVLFLPVALYFVASRALLVVRGRGLPSVRIPASWGWLAFWTILLYAILRNLPFAPFNWLAPSP